MQIHSKNEKSDFIFLRDNSLSNNLNNDNERYSKSFKSNSENVTGSIPKSESYSQSSNLWNEDSSSSFVFQLKSEHTNSSTNIFNSCDVTLEDDFLTPQLKRIKESYQSACQPLESSYLGNSVSVSLTNDKMPLTISTVNIDKNILIMNTDIDENTNPCLKYEVINSDTGMNIHEMNNINSNTNILQLKNLSNSNSKVIQPHSITRDTNVIYSPSIAQFNYNNTYVDLKSSVKDAESFQSVGFIKTPVGIIYAMIPELPNNDNQFYYSNPSTVIDHSRLDKKNLNNNKITDIDGSIDDCRDLENRKFLDHKQTHKDMDASKYLRLEKIRYRNRAAARRCRDKKNSLIASLEEKCATQTSKIETFRDKLLKTLRELCRINKYVSSTFPDAKFPCFTKFLEQIKLNELSNIDLNDFEVL